MLEEAVLADSSSDFDGVDGSGEHAATVRAPAVLYRPFTSFETSAMHEDAVIAIPPHGAHGRETSSVLDAVARTVKSGVFIAASSVVIRGCSSKEFGWS